MLQIILAQAQSLLSSEPLQVTAAGLCIWQTTQLHKSMHGPSVCLQLELNLAMTLVEAHSYFVIVHMI